MSKKDNIKTVHYNRRQEKIEIEQFKNKIKNAVLSQIENIINLKTI